MPSVQPETQKVFTETMLKDGVLYLAVPFPPEPHSGPTDERRGRAKSKDPAYRQVSFWIPKDLHEAIKLRVIAESYSGRDQSDLFADALRSYLAISRAGTGEQRTQGRGFASRAAARG